MSEFSDSEKGYGNEPTETRYENGGVLEDSQLAEYGSQDEHYAAVEHLVDTGVANVADASARLGYDPAEYAKQEAEDELDALFAAKPQNYDPHPGAAVSLDERAAAVTELMDGVNVQNRLNGARRSGALNKYSNPERVQEGMERDARFHRQAQGRAVETLAKTAALRAIGFTELEALASQVAVNREFSQHQGTGQRAVAERAKQKKRVQRTANKIAGRDS